MTQTSSFLDIVTEQCSQPPVQQYRWQIKTDSNSWWLSLQNEQVRQNPLPGQGWKLHISAGLATAETILRRVLPILLHQSSAFKVASSSERLELLNFGEAGLSQIGKFITIYPRNDEEAVQLASMLHEATYGLRGPAIPSDRPFLHGSLIYYRYGSFQDLYIQTPAGITVPIIYNPEGQLVPDERFPYYLPPSWAEDPFIAAGVTTELPKPSPLIAQRYLIVETISQTARGSVARGINIVGRYRCILKRAANDGFMQLNGSDARDRLQHEFEVLQLLNVIEQIPKVFDLVNYEGDLFLIIEDIEGITLSEYVEGVAILGRSIPLDQLVCWASELALILEAIHNQGFIYRDLKSQNIIVTPDHHIRLIDFDFACPKQGEQLPWGGKGGGTRGYMSPQQLALMPPTVLDDIYSYGAILYFITTGAEPSEAPYAQTLLRRPLELLNPRIDDALHAFIYRCLDPEAKNRFATMSELITSLKAIQAPPKASCQHPLVRRHKGLEFRRSLYEEQASMLGDSLCLDALRLHNGAHLTWHSTEDTTKQERFSGIYTGSAGVLLVLAELVAKFDREAHCKTLRAGLDTLLSSIQREPTENVAVGLYTGRAGVAATLLRAGQVLKDQALILQSRILGHDLLQMCGRSPDLLSGDAGLLRLYLLLWDEFADANLLASAKQIGVSLIVSAQADPQGGLFWPIPTSIDEGTQPVGVTGYAHGAAGIADSLLDLFDASKDPQFFHAAEEAGRWIIKQAAPALDDHTGFTWPKIVGDTKYATACWANGATGIGRFFLHLFQSSMADASADYAVRAAKTSAGASRWLGPSQAYGLAGNIEFLLDMFQSTGDDFYLEAAMDLAALLESFMVDDGGQIRWSSLSPKRNSPDYMVGYAGIVLCLLRLSAPEYVPHQLSRQGFKHRW